MDSYSLIAAWAGWPVIVAILVIAGSYAGWLLKNRIDTQKEIIERLEREFVRRQERKKAIEHYLLFWEKGEKGWAKDDWVAAQAYIGKFHPACGFSQIEASLAEKVTIIGRKDGVGDGAEEFLIAAKCKVERLDGQETKDTADLLNKRVREGRAFEGGHIKCGYN